MARSRPSAKKSGETKTSPPRKLARRKQVRQETWRDKADPQNPTLTQGFDGSREVERGFDKLSLDKANFDRLGTHFTAMKRASLCFMAIVVSESYSDKPANSACA
ncbi:MAG TPA: hypothetical protein PKN80_03675 [bacterium]|nr:hypothetical protein [bacterium]HNS48710.1 hypothetical protein [bacterium]